MTWPWACVIIFTTFFVMMTLTSIFKKDGQNGTVNKDDDINY